MYCDKCGAKLEDDASFCSVCGKNLKTKNKNIYIALVLSFILTGLGSIYAENTKKGLALLIIRVLTAALSVFSVVFSFLSVLVWVYGLYEAYRDVEIANGQHNPRLLNDFKRWDSNEKTIAVLIIAVILIFFVIGCTGLIFVNNYSYDDSGTHYHVSSSGSGSSGGSSHYGGVDTSPNTIAKKDPDWYYDHYEYGDNQDIDDYLESQGYD